MAASKSASAPKNVESMAVTRSCRMERSMFCRTVLIEKTYSRPCDSTVRRSASAITAGGRLVWTSSSGHPMKSLYCVEGRYTVGVCALRMSYRLALLTDDLQIPPVPRVHNIEGLGDGVVIWEEFLGKVLAHYGYAGRMVVVLPFKLTAL